MRARIRDLYPKQLTLQSDRPETIFNRVDWVQVYQEINGGQEVAVRLHFGTGPLHFYQNPYSLIAVIQGNTVTIIANNVDSLRLYFNQSMVDFSKPVTVIANNLVRFKGMLTPSVSEMLKDQLFLGRGWRNYQAVLDVDMTGPAPSDAPATPATPAADGTPAVPTTRPHGRITVYNDDGSVQRVIEPP
jgi:hypothetical protein